MDEEVAGETAQEAPQDEPEPAPQKKKDKPPKKKGNWKTIGHEPVNYELHPCPHRWQKVHPKGPCIQYKQVRWILLPLSDRMAQLALPLLRRLLALWLEFGDKFPPEMRARLLAFLVNNYGLSEEFLEQILEEARAAREAAEKGEGKKEKKGKKRKGKRKKKKKKKGGKKGKEKGKKGGKKKGKEKKEKAPKAEKTKAEKKQETGLLFKRRKAGKLPLDWPYKMGSKFLLSCISLFSKDPDEDYNSRATEYFDVQSMAILEQFCKYMDMALPDPEKPTQYGETLVIMALNISDWIAKYVTTPAQAIPDDKVDEYLDLRGIRPKKPKPKKEKPPKEGKGKKGKKEEEEKPPEPETEIQRNWNELRAPVYVPEKSRISKRKNAEEEVGGGDVGDTTDAEGMNEEEGVPRWKEPTLDDIKQEFLEYINWYNPWEPEFMYFGPRKTPTGVAMYNSWDADSDSIPHDLRILHWNQVEYGFADDYSFIPGPVPQYYPALRPLRPIRLEDLEKSGVPKEIIKKNLRFFSPWYLMSKPLKPPPPPPDEEEAVAETEMMGEFDEEYLEDEMLQHPKEPPIKDSVWGSPGMREQLEILGHLLHLMSSVPDLTIEYVFEQLEEFCEAVECAQQDENPTQENLFLAKKRTIILEQYFVDFFGKKFRDYNERTPYYMRVLCSRCAYYIQILYEYTARVLWDLQCQTTPVTPIESRPETPDDPEALRDWDDWLAWLLKVTKTCDEWAGWISETVDEAERKAAKKKREFVDSAGKKVPLTAEEWYEWKSEVEQKVNEYKASKRQIYRESPYYAEKGRNILPVKHRQKVCEWDEEEFGEGEEEEGGDDDGLWKDVGNEADTETEWEDVGEFDN